MHDHEMVRARAITWTLGALIAASTVAPDRGSADPPACRPLRFEHVTPWEPFACVHVEGTTGCPAASATGYVRAEQAGGTCGPARDALYGITMPRELTSVGSAVLSRDLELLFLGSDLTSGIVRVDDVLGVAFKHGQPYRLLRGNDFGVPEDGLTQGRLSVSMHPSGAFVATLFEGVRFRATVLVEAPPSPARGGRAPRR